MKAINRVILLILFVMGINSIVKAQKPDRVILLVIDGLHWEAPERLNMPVFNSLVKEGVYIQKSYVIIPHHPTIGDYGKYNTSSFPNPMIQGGTIFIKPENKMIQEMISPQNPTAFLANDVAYRTIARGATTTILDTSLSDDQIITLSIEVLKNQDPRFMRIHMQTPGNMGFLVSNSGPEKEYYRNIFGKGSPYIVSVEHADKLLGQLITYLKGSEKWERTILIVTGDHGQSIIGWHPPFEEDGWVTPLVITGPGIAKGRQLPYFEIIDIAPTIAWLLGVQIPNVNGGEGRIVKEILEGIKSENYIPSSFIRTI
ncbi:MAG: sulfatase-like hydrolase/transferase, partial [Bacteroidales bacterium]|nr:sulfatase-like hydrolase/transferase [Bacteroidales bacterium]